LLILTITRTGRENKTQSIANGDEFLVGQIEANKNLVKASHLARSHFVKLQDKPVTSKPRFNYATIDYIPLNRDFDVNSPYPRNGLP